MFKGRTWHTTWRNDSKIILGVSFHSLSEVFLGDIQPAQVPAQVLVSLGNFSVNRDSDWSCDLMRVTEPGPKREMFSASNGYPYPMCLFIAAVFFDLQIICLKNYLVPEYCLGHGYPEFLLEFCYWNGY